MGNKSNSIPSCTVLVKDGIKGFHKRKFYGKKKDTLYLNDGDYIQLKIKNPLPNRIGAKIKFNEKKEKGFLVIDPYQEVIVERYLSDNNKIQFHVYDIENRKEVKKMIKKNGEIKISFFNEKNYTPNYTYTYNYTSGTTYTYGLNSTSGTDGSLYINDNTTNSSPLLGNYFNSSTTIDTIKTGRVGKGEQSDQIMLDTHFTMGDKINEIKFNLLPYSYKKEESPKLSDYMNNEKPLYHESYKQIDNNSVRIYCNNCGYRVRNRRWNFCPTCGNRVL